MQKLVDTHPPPVSLCSHIILLPQPNAYSFIDTLDVLCAQLEGAVVLLMFSG